MANPKGNRFNVLHLAGTGTPVHLPGYNYKQSWNEKDVNYFQNLLKSINFSFFLRKNCLFFSLSPKLVLGSEGSATFWLFFYSYKTLMKMSFLARSNLQIVDFLSLFAFQTFKTNHCRKLLSLSWLQCSMAFILQKTHSLFWTFDFEFKCLHFYTLKLIPSLATPRSGVLLVTLYCYLSTCLTSASASNEIWWKSWMNATQLFRREI